MAFTKKPKFNEQTPEKGRSVVYYLGGHPWKAVPVHGVIDETNEFVDQGMTSYTFFNIDPDSKKRWTYCDCPHHLYFFSVKAASDPEKMFEVKATAKDKKIVEKLQRGYVVELTKGILKPRKEAMQLESDLRDIGA